MEAWPRTNFAFNLRTELFRDLLSGGVPAVRHGYTIDLSLLTDRDS